MTTVSIIVRFNAVISRSLQSKQRVEQSPRLLTDGNRPSVSYIVINYTLLHQAEIYTLRRNGFPGTVRSFFATVILRACHATCGDFRPASPSVTARRAKHIENEQSKAVSRFPTSIIDERDSSAYLALEIQWHIAGGVQLCLRFHLMRQHTVAVPGRYGGRQHVGML